MFLNCRREETWTDNTAERGYILKNLCEILQTQRQAFCHFTFSYGLRYFMLKRSQNLQFFWPLNIWSQVQISSNLVILLSDKKKAVCGSKSKSIKTKSLLSRDFVA